MSVLWPDDYDEWPQLEDVDPAVADSGTDADAELWNKIQDAIAALEAELGLGLGGEHDTLADRVQAIQDYLYTLAGIT